MKNQSIIVIAVVVGLILGAVLVRTIQFHSSPAIGGVKQTGYQSVKSALDERINQVYSVANANMQSIMGIAPLPTISCDDPVWCSIEMPRESHFRFEPPLDLYRWRRAQNQAASGEQVLLKNIRKSFKHHFDFLDGDTSFRKYHALADIFLDHNTDLRELTKQDTRKIGLGSSKKTNRIKKTKLYEWDKWGYDKEVVPRGYDFRAMKRAPIVMVGYQAFSTANHSHDFEGPHLGQAAVGVPHLIKTWNAVKHMIDTPFIILHAGNENWGLFSTEFPNRTIDWGKCCSDYPHVQEMLDHPMTLMVLTNQHHNLTHPKVVSLPRGLPTYTTHRSKYLYDIMRMHEQSTVKDTLLFSSNSNWKHRPYISKCIADKFQNETDTKINAYTVKHGNREAGRMTFDVYYQKIVSSRTSMCLAGLGYDSFRLWETLTMGTVPIIEKGTGLDKALWRLPALLVEDFDLVTPALLRSAYVEALYRAEEFEFERLTQSFWWTFIANVSTTMSREAIDIPFPPNLSEDSTFARPKVPYDCGSNMEKCGPGTKRTPRSSCGGKPASLRTPDR